MTRPSHNNDHDMLDASGAQDDEADINSLLQSVDENDFEVVFNTDCPLQPPNHDSIIGQASQLPLFKVLF